MRDAKILIGPSTFGTIDRTPLERLEQAGLTVIPNPFGRKFEKDELLRLLPGVQGIIAGMEPLTRDVLEQSQLRAIARCGVGLENVDLDAARELGISVSSTPEAPTAAVAELTVGSMITLLRGVPQMDRNMHAGHWSKHIGIQIGGKTIAIVGFGRIGRKVAKLLRPFNARCVAVDPALSGRVDGVEVLTLREALAQADVVTLHASGGTEILGEDELRLMKRGAFLLNAGRSGLVNEASLCKALDNGTVAGAWIDSFAQEPYDGPLVRYPQVILTPHVGSASVECRRQMELEAVENLLRALRPWISQELNQ